MKKWNQCDICGKFIAIADFDTGMAIRVHETPDAGGTRETYYTAHIKCDEKYHKWKTQ